MIFIDDALRAIGEHQSFSDYMSVHKLHVQPKAREAYLNASNWITKCGTRRKAFAYITTLINTFR